MSNVDDAPLTGKGRATPKRSEARSERAKQRKVAAGVTRKERAAERRTAMRAARESLNQTDVSKLPPTEKKPELVYTRDLIDSRFYIGQALVWLMGAVVIANLVPPLTRISLAVGLVGLISIGTVTWRDCKGIQRKVDARYPQTSTRVRGYALRRIFAPRRLRKPVPRLARGAQVG